MSGVVFKEAMAALLLWTSQGMHVTIAFIQWLAGKCVTGQELSIEIFVIVEQIIIFSSSVCCNTLRSSDHDIRINYSDTISWLVHCASHVIGAIASSHWKSIDNILFVFSSMQTSFNDMNVRLSTLKILTNGRRIILTSVNMRFGLGINNFIQETPNWKSKIE